MITTKQFMHMFDFGSIQFYPGIICMVCMQMHMHDTILNLLHVCSNTLDMVLYTRRSSKSTE